VGNNNPTPTPTAAPTAKPVVLIWWDLFNTEKDVKPLIDAYTKDHPNVKIQYIAKEYNADFNKYVKELDEALVDEQQTPSIFPIYNTWAGKYESLVTKAPASEINEAYFNDYYPIVKKDFYNKGAIALPQSLDAIAIIYNLDKIQEKGYTEVATNWSEFKTMAQKLTTKTSESKISSAGFSAGFYDNVQFRFDVFNNLMMVSGITMTDVNNKEAIFYNPEQKDDTDTAYKFYKELASTTWSKDMKKDIAAFLDGKLAMYAAPSWRLIDILNYNKQYNLNLKIGVAPMPQLANRVNYWPAYWGYAVSKTGQNSNEAWKFVKYLNETSSLQLLNKTVKDNGRPIGIIYPRISMNTDLAQDKYLGPYVNSLAKADDWYMRDGLKMQSVFNNYLGQPIAQNDLSGLQSGANAVIKNQ
jgi:ABC-type glycerol-3-phosphate transport system substrate-binding protein